MVAKRFILRCQSCTETEPRVRRYGDWMLDDARLDGMRIREAGVQYPVNLILETFHFNTARDIIKVI